MIHQKIAVDRLAAAESLVLAMPELDARFSELPAQIDFAAPEQSGKVNQPDIEILHEATKGMNALDRVLESRRAGIAPLFDAEKAGTIELGATAESDPLAALMQFDLGLLELRLETERLLNRRLYVGQEPFGLRFIEESRHSLC